MNENKNIKKLIDKRPINDKCEAHGFWEVYTYQGDVSYKCYCLNGNKVGYEENHWYHFLDDGQTLNLNFYL